MVTNVTWPLRVLAIREQVDAMELLHTLGFEVRRGGQMTCPNPAHPDQHPSAKFYPEGGKVFCFTCAQTWDLVGLVQLVHGLAFPEAVAWLEEQFLVQTVDDADAVARTLRRYGYGRVSDCSGLAAMVETAIQQARDRCTIAGYARLWRAYDVACHGFANRKIDEATFVAALDRVLALTPPDLAPVQP